MDSSPNSPEQSGTLSSHSLQNIAKAVIPLLSIPKIDAPETQTSPTEQSMSRGVAGSAIHVEDKMSLEQFEQLKETFYSNDGDNHQGYLTKDQFKLAISGLLGIHDQDHMLSLLFVKIDTTCDGLIDWNQFCSYLLMQFQDKDRILYGRPVPFQSHPKLRHNMYNKETICRIMTAVNPPRYITVSKDGAVCVWNTSLQLQRGSNISLGQSQHSSSHSAVGHNVAGSLWITDCILMNNCNKLVVATTSNELLFLDMSTMLCHCQHRIAELPHIPLCLDYHYDPQHPAASSYLLCGDESGSVMILQFPTPTIKLFSGNDVTSRPFKITLQTIMEATSPRCQVINGIHDDWVQQLKYIPHNHSFISCSASNNSSLVISDIELKNKSYVFKLRKGVSCFDFSHKLDILVTGSMDHLIHVWNPYVPAKPIATMSSHASTVIAVLLNDQLNVIFSYSQDGVLMCWDLHEHTLLQYITVRFPFSQRLPDYGPRPLYQTPSSVMVTCNEHIAEYQLGITDYTHSYSRWSITTQKHPLCAALYSSCFHQVVVGGEGSEVNVWDIDTGEMVVQFGDCHGNNEITAMTIDASGRRLITGSRKGDIKVWNFLSGECQKTLIGSKEGNEITGLVHLPDKKQFLSVGWDKKITTFPDMPDVMKVYPDEYWQCEGGTHHNDDILCIAYCRPHYLATGSFDGQIIVWNVDCEKMVAHFRTRTASKLDSIQLTRTESLVTSSSRCSTRQSRSSRPTSRRLFYHRVKSASLKVQHVPVDQLVFLKSRLQSRMTATAANTGVLVSSEHGDACCYELTGNETPSGAFRMTKFEEENVWALTTDHKNTLLIAGDTAGYLYVFDISTWCCNSNKVEELSSWRAHVAEVVSVEYIPSDDGGLVLTASADCTARLWTINGNYIGTFGQEQRWNIKDPLTYQHPLTPWGGMKRPSSVLSNHISSATSSAVQLPPVEEVTTTDQVEVPDVSVTMVSSNKPKEELGETLGSSSTVDYSSHVSLSSQPQPAWNKGMKILLGCKPTLGQPYNKTIQQRMKGKQERRQLYAEIDLKRTQRFGTLCSAFQALQMPVICDAGEQVPNVGAIGDSRSDNSLHNAKK